MPSQRRKDDGTGDSKDRSTEQPYGRHRSKVQARPQLKGSRDKYVLCGPREEARTLLRNGSALSSTRRKKPDTTPYIAKYFHQTRTGALIRGTLSDKVMRLSAEVGTRPAVSVLCEHALFDEIRTYRSNSDLQDTMANDVPQTISLGRAVSSRADQASNLNPGTVQPDP